MSSLYFVGERLVYRLICQQNSSSPSINQLDVRQRRLSQTDSKER